MPYCIVWLNTEYTFIFQLRNLIDCNSMQTPSSACQHTATKIRQGISSIYGNATSPTCSHQYAMTIQPK